MKSATVPSLRVDPELRGAAETVLEEGETELGKMLAKASKRVRG